MGYRLSKIITRTGDDGTTGLGDGTRVPKDCARIEAIGAIDELNSAIGVVLAMQLPDTPPTREPLLDVQHRLFDLGGELAVPGMTLMTAQRVAELEQWVGQLNAELPALREFVLPGGTPAAAACHVARAVCRRAERRCWTVAHSEENLSASALHYLNRLSDLLFLLARIYARAGGNGEVLWQHDRGGKPGGHESGGGHLD
jgi:cob(I)alamin adenosyltransferase